MTRRPTASIIASPVLVGAVTLLVTIVAVFLAYNANSGLPFVPTYDLTAELPGGANLVKGNDVRIGGFRVGLVEEIGTKTVVENGERRAVATVRMKLDKAIEPLRADTGVIVRPRSALGLKYVELTPGRSARTLAPGATIPLANAEPRVEFDDVLNTFDADLRLNSRAALEGFGDALAGRGPSLNAAIEELRPFVVHLEPVMRALSDPDTELDELFEQLGRAAAEVAPVAEVQAELFSGMAETFEAISRCSGCLQQTIEKAPPTLDTAIASFRVQQPFLAALADASHRLRPAARELPSSLPRLNDALAAGEPVLPRTVALNERVERVFAALDELAENPSTLLALEDLTTTVKVTRPLVEFVAPYQTVCNNGTYFFTALADHFSVPLAGSTGHLVTPNSTNRVQDNSLSQVTTPDRPADIPSDVDPDTARAADGEPLTALHGHVYKPAIDAQGNADCQTGQQGYLDGPLGPNGRYPPAPSSPDFDARFSGGSHVVVEPDIPGLSGPTFTGVPHLKDVP